MYTIYCLFIALYFNIKIRLTQTESIHFQRTLLHQIFVLLRHNLKSEHQYIEWKRHVPQSRERCSTQLLTHMRGPIMLFSPSSHSMWGCIVFRNGLRGAPARQKASSMSRPQLRKVFNAVEQTSLELHTVMRTVWRGLSSYPNFLLISPISTANSLMQSWKCRGDPVN